MTDPWAVVDEHERQATASDRRRRGAWYTPREVVSTLVGLTLSGLDTDPSFVVDPSCGGGAFLLGTLDALVSRGLAPREALTRVGGIDIEPSAIAAARSAIGLWCEGRGLPASDSEGVALFVGDALLGRPEGWPDPDVVIGNPPFASPLRGGAFPEGVDALRKARSELLGPYADLAALHLLRAVELCAAGGRVCLVLPQSLLAGRDTAGLRRWLDECAPPIAVWASATDRFAASVKVWAPVLGVGADRDRVHIRGSIGARTVGAAPWAELAAEALGVPAVVLNPRHRGGPRAEPVAVLGSIARATAGFRDEYYGIAAVCREEVCCEEVCCEEVESSEVMRIVTSGSLDPLQCRWGARPTTFAKRRWQRPVARRADFDGALARWVDQQRRPKLVLPTQSRLFEPVIDPDGSLLPVTPVLAVHCDQESLGLVAAVLLAPPIVAWAQRKWFGAALSIDALKLAASDLAQLPLPVDADDLWHEAATLALSIDSFELEQGRRRVVLDRVATLMTQAYGAGPEVLGWWRARLPPANR